MPDEKAQAEAEIMAHMEVVERALKQHPQTFSERHLQVEVLRLRAALESASIKQADEMSLAFNTEIAGLQARHKAERESASKQNGALLALIIDRLQEAGGTLDDKLRWQIVMDLQQDIRQGDETASQWWLDTFADLKKERESASKREAELQWNLVKRNERIVEREDALVLSISLQKALQKALVERDSQIAELTKREAELLDALKRAYMALANAYDLDLGAMEPDSLVAQDIAFIQAVIAKSEVKR